MLRPFTLGVAVALAVLGCSSGGSSVPVTIAVHADMAGDILRIHGNATVPDGAWIIYAAYRPTGPDRRAKGYVRVKDGRFAAEVNTAGWPRGPIRIDADFQIFLPERTQPAAVVARYGQNGERMSGADVVQGGGAFRAAVSSATIIKR